ncbi:MAG TPA: hypothetical protein VHU84_05590 [Lacipirellulaceae bacterium]|jgi:hypothetical protein|nr:hypothetical protein [Lacipirellulaceae bacterium]
MPATRSDWKTVELPTQRKLIPFDRTYTAAEFARIKEGLIPECMEDKWFEFYEEPWLYFHRSWTGYCVYQLRLEPVATGTRVAELWSAATRSNTKRRTIPGMRCCLPCYWTLALDERTKTYWTSGRCSFVPATAVLNRRMPSDSLHLLLLELCPMIAMNQPMR